VSKRSLTDKEALDEIHAVMDEAEWSPDTLDAVVEVLLRAGYVMTDHDAE
jgi:hypothetical protein